MSVFNQLECLESKGYITNGQMSQMKKIAASLPSTASDLLAIIAASSLMKSEEVMLNSPLGVQSITSTDTVTIGSLTVPADATRAIVSVHGNNIIFRLDGGNPALLTGHFGEKNRNFVIGNLADFKFVSESTTDAVIFVTYY